MTNRNKQRGKYFEDKIAASIRKSWSLKPHQCKRCAFSGEANHEYGDIWFNDYEKYPVVLECKFQAFWNFQSLFKTLPQKFYEFMEQLGEAVDQYAGYFGQQPAFSGVVFSKPKHPVFCLSWYPPVQNMWHIYYPKLGDARNMDLYIYKFDDVLWDMKGVYGTDELPL